LPTTGKLVDMAVTDLDAPLHAKAPPTARVALALGLHGALGEELLARLVSDARYSWVHVGLRHSLGSATPKYRPWVIGQSTILADDGYLCLSDDQTPATASPIARFRATDAVRAIDIVRAAGVRRLVVITPETSDPDEAKLGATDFETLVIVRPDVQNARTEPGWVRRALDAMSRIAPQASSRPSTQTGRAMAASVLAAFDLWGPGVHRLTFRELAALAGGAPPGRSRRDARA